MSWKKDPPLCQNFVEPPFALISAFSLGSHCCGLEIVRVQLAQFQPGNAVRLRGRFDRHLCGFLHRCLYKMPPEVDKSSTGTTFGNRSGAAKSGAALIWTVQLPAIANRTNVNPGLVCWDMSLLSLYI